MEALAHALPASSCPFSTGTVERDNTAANKKHYVVVGDRIKGQCTSDLFISADTAHALARSEQSPITFHIGQGVSDDKLSHLYSLNQAQVSLVPEQRQPRACGHTTHKHEPRNIAISKVVDNGNGTYTAALMIDEANAELSDHLTGQHISGMMIVEAARQLSIATAEQFYIAPAARGKANFITHSMRVDYNDFLLPVPTQILCIPVTLKRSGPINFRFTVLMQFRQQGQTLASVEFDTSVIDSRYFYLKESQLLHRYITLMD
ncbi:AfsA-related hotdog domain-containing protein [Pseudomonas sp. UFMG81]|uniref:AfsA-related hotdog domain-containing protein n=1 Tax=Pseudomonas sp. UFMG81 TaxID=2745936 RepID=UPI00188EE9E4|nr:AfsA-related hotdog domain-containing protein [Pseudomonas sp. UFMG81]